MKHYYKYLILIHGHCFDCVYHVSPVFLGKCTVSIAYCDKYFIYNCIIPSHRRTHFALFLHVTCNSDVISETHQPAHRNVTYRFAPLEINKKINLVDETKKTVWAFPWNHNIIHCCANNSNEENMSLSPNTDNVDADKYGISCERSSGKCVKSGSVWINPLKHRPVKCKLVSLSVVENMLSVNESENSVPLNKERKTHIKSWIW